MSDYTYRSPTEYGYTRFKLSRKQHKELFPRRVLRWNQKCEYYYNDNNVLIHYFSNHLCIILTTVLFPILILFAGLSHFKEAIKEMKELYNEKKYGSFSTDHISKCNRGKNKYDEIMNYIKEQGVIE
ncbi:hypothetical protein [Paenibacillus tianjinensis]|uniref:Uncharacterized protein n=1 Tax=Paenibacillus tianjinensis TaxID=2810347 RepID=A0ABX7L5N8_9BACL|nr:hypothetical protein [Paenibacillus tianjinensis]QSF43388.1 hypothetical protein JRJ22_19165 [Paenibacillus tianjinensis]